MSFEIRIETPGEAEEKIKTNGVRQKRKVGIESTLSLLEQQSQEINSIRPAASLSSAANFGPESALCGSPHDFRRAVSFSERAKRQRAMALIWLLMTGYPFCLCASLPQRNLKSYRL